MILWKGLRPPPQTTMALPTMNGSWTEPFHLSGSPISLAKVWGVDEFGGNGGDYGEQGGEAAQTKTPALSKGLCRPNQKKKKRQGQSPFMAATPRAPVIKLVLGGCQGRGGSTKCGGLVNMRASILWRGLRQHRPTKRQRRSPSDL